MKCFRFVLAALSLAVVAHSASACNFGRGFVGVSAFRVATPFVATTSFVTPLAVANVGCAQAAVANVGCAQAAVANVGYAQASVVTSQAVIAQPFVARVGVVRARAFAIRTRPFLARPRLLLRSRGVIRRR